MTHYDKEREADELWRNAPEGAEFYACKMFYKSAEGSLLFFENDFWHQSQWSLADRKSRHDYQERPQHATKQPEAAQGELKQPDPVNHPKHYAIAPGVEAIDIIKASLTPEQFKGYLLGNLLKYRLRAGDKDDLKQDIAKSNWYRNKLNEN